MGQTTSAPGWAASRRDRPIARRADPPPCRPRTRAREGRPVDRSRPPIAPHGKNGRRPPASSDADSPEGGRRHQPADTNSIVEVRSGERRIQSAAGSPTEMSPITKTSIEPLIMAHAASVKSAFRVGVGSRVEAHVPPARPANRWSPVGLLVEIVEEAADACRKVVVFSYFRQTLATVPTALDGLAMGPCTGSVPPIERQKLVDKFTARCGPRVTRAHNVREKGLATVVVGSSRGRRCLSPRRSLDEAEREPARVRLRVHTRRRTHHQA
jgi:hypothetical protein